MPSPYVVRRFTSNQIIHITNRGVAQCEIFLDKDDYIKFMEYLAIYLWGTSRVLAQWPKIRPNLIKSNLSSQIKLLSYCLMPNHFHLLVQQQDDSATSLLMHRLTIAYTKYFNEKYNRKGSLVQGPFRTTYINNEASLLQESRYIHLNPIRARLTERVANYPWSSIQEYLGNGTQICQRDVVMSYFAGAADYLGFVERIQPDDFPHKRE